jgi:hypothetical protein
MMVMCPSLVEADDACETPDSTVSMKRRLVGR